MLHQLENNNLLSSITNFEQEIYKSGSIGQVYRAKYNNSAIILKVQYVNLREQTLQDLKILDLVISYLYDFVDAKNAICDIKTKIIEELDYENEVRNHKIVYDIFKNDENIRIPKIFDNLCSDKIITMEYMENYVSYDYFIHNSTQEQKNYIGTLIIKFIFECLYRYNIIYSDSHYGNFLVKNDFTGIAVLDFGSLIFIDNELKNNLINIHLSLKHKDEEYFLHILKTLGIIKDNTSEESKRYAYEFFTLQYEPLITNENFEFMEEWLDITSDKNTELMKEWTCPSNMVHLNKISYGLYHLLTKINLNSNLGNVLDEIIYVVKNPNEINLK
jgi:predicted unusual protein kinase regulating ubiquinone biosynthesis (AarF/ABC1/UbiB family)